MHNTITISKSHKKILKLWFRVKIVCALVPLCCMCACIMCATHERLRDQACQVWSRSFQSCNCEFGCWDLYWLFLCLHGYFVW